MKPSGSPECGRYGGVRPCLAAWKSSHSAVGAPFPPHREAHRGSLSMTLFQWVRASGSVGKNLEMSVVPIFGLFMAPSMWTALSMPWILNLQSGMHAFSPLPVRSRTVRTGYAAPVAFHSRRSDGRMTQCMADTTLSAGGVQRPGSRQPTRSSFSMYCTCASHSFQQLGPLRFTMGMGSGANGGAKPVRMSASIPRE